MQNILTKYNLKITNNLKEFLKQNQEYKYDYYVIIEHYGTYFISENLTYKKEAIKLYNKLINIIPRYYYYISLKFGF